MYVCSSDNDESCVYCTTIGETEKESCTRLGCESVITGNRVKLVGEKNGIVICDVSVMGIKSNVDLCYRQQIYFVLNSVSNKQTNKL